MTVRTEERTSGAGAATRPVDDAERLAALAIQAIQGIGATYAKRLVDEAGSFRAVFEAGGDLAERAGVPHAYAARISANRDKAFERAEKQLTSARAAGMMVRVLTEPGYPGQLREIPDPPPALYIYGEAIPSDDLAIGIVGTRKATQTGLAMAEELARELAASGITVVSGLALGVDAAAHKGALDTDGGRTIAVLGTGADVCYPPGNRNLYDRIIKSNCGAVVSEFSPGTKPEAFHFPIRNRIISGLSLGVVVVEAPERSGALITARVAIEQGREVFAIPHSARSGAGAGTNRLIREGAHLVERVEDILSVIDYQARLLAARHAKRARAPSTQIAATGPGASAIFELIRDGVHNMDDLVARSGQAVSAVLAELTRLELDGRIRRTAVSTFQTAGRTA